MDVPASIVWISNVLKALPSPTDTWVALIGELAWPAVIVFLVIRFKRFLSQFLNTLMSRLETDHIKTPWFEMSPDSSVYFLDPDEVEESTERFSQDDIQRIERIFEFMDEPGGYKRIVEWLNEKFYGDLDVENFATNLKYANERQTAFEEIPGLDL